MSYDLRGVSKILNSYPAQIESELEGNEELKVSLWNLCRSMDSCIPGNLSANEYYSKYCSIVQIEKNSIEHPFVNAVLNNQQMIIDIFFSLSDQGFNVNCHGEDGKTAAHVAASSGNLDFICNTKNLDIRVKDLFGNTVLHDAVHGNQYDVVDYLVNVQKMDPSAKNNARVSPAQLAEKERLSQISDLFKR